MAFLKFIRQAQHRTKAGIGPFTAISHGHTIYVATIRTIQPFHAYKEAFLGYGYIIGSHPYFLPALPPFGIDDYAVIQKISGSSKAKAA